MISTYSFLSLLAIFIAAVLADDPTDCAPNCLSNVNGTNCRVSDWICLCESSLYISRLNKCIVKGCDSDDQQQAFQAVAELCAIFSVPLTELPEATESTSSAAQTYSDVGPVVPSSIPAVTTPTPTGSGNPTTASTSAGGYTIQTSLPPSPTTTPTTTASETASQNNATGSQSTGGGVAGRLTGERVVLTGLAVLLAHFWAM